MIVKTMRKQQINSVQCSIDDDVSIITQSHSFTLLQRLDYIHLSRLFICHHLILTSQLRSFAHSKIAECVLLLFNYSSLSFAHRLNLFTSHQSNILVNINIAYFTSLELDAFEQSCIEQSRIHRLCMLHDITKVNY